MNKEVTVIIPMYNAEKYIDECLSSINYNIAECIVINDNSTDNSIKIASKYPCKIMNLHQNKGQGYCKNIGIDFVRKHLKTPYIMFLDADDYYSKNTIEIMLKEIKDCDIVVCNTRTFGDIKRDYGKLKLNGLFKLNKEISQNTPCVAWNKIYKTEMLEDIYFSESIPEDNPFWFTFCCKNYGCKIKFIKNYLCNYRQVEYSSYHQQEVNKNCFYDSIKSCFYMYDWLIKNNKRKFLGWFFRCYFFNFIFLYCRIKSIRFEEIEERVKTLCKQRNINFNKIKQKYMEEKDVKSTSQYGSTKKA